MVKETLVMAWGEIAAAPFPNCSSWAIWQAVRGAGRQSPDPSGVHQAEPGLRKAMSEQPHTWLANAGRGGVFLKRYLTHVKSSPAAGLLGARP
jgi:hypothetical protein